MRTRNPLLVNAIKEARRFIARQPDDENARILASLVLALESDRSFELVTLYKLDYKAFNLAIDVLREWRLDRYYAGKAKLFDLSFHVDALAQPQAAAAAPTAAEKPSAAPAKAAAAATAQQAAPAAPAAAPATSS